MARGEIVLPGETRAKTACGHDSCGCAKALCCLECPLGVCLLEVSRDSKRAVLVDERRHTALQMRSQGKTLATIARQLGVSRSTVGNLLAGDGR